MRRNLLSLLVVVCALAPAGARAVVGEPCAPTPRAPANPAYQAQDQAFGFHDEELVICSPGVNNPIHIAARLWVPASCPGVGGCPGVLIAHGLGFSKEFTFSDMLTAVRKGMYALSYDVRGQGMSGGQAEMLGRDDVADQAAMLKWWHDNVRPTKTAVYGISQGGWLAWVGAIYNCGAERAAHFDSRIPCERGGRWVDAIVPMQGLTQTIDDHTCTEFFATAIAESRGNSALADAWRPCPTEGRMAPIAGAFLDTAHRMSRIDVPVYIVTSFFDRLVPPRHEIASYEQLRARASNPSDVLYGKDVRLLISNDGHGDVGGNTAIVGDVFTWMHHELAGGPGLRNAPVTIAQQWANNTFRLENAWPIPGSTKRTLYLTPGSLSAAPSGAAEELRNIPIATESPSLPMGGIVVPTNNTQAIPDNRLVYLSAPLSATTEITGEPLATFYVSSANQKDQGLGQLNVGLSDVDAQGNAVEFSHERVGLIGLGPKPMRVQMPLSVSSRRVAAGDKLMLVISSSDTLIAFPAPGPDAFYINHDARWPSSLTIPIAPISRTPPSGAPPSGTSYTDDPLKAICETIGLPCG